MASEGWGEAAEGRELRAARRMRWRVRTRSLCLDGVCESGWRRPTVPCGIRPIVHSPRQVYRDRMKKNTPPRSGRMMVHSEGIGAADATDLRQRAHELALIAGRSKPNATDLDQARQELQGGGLPPIGEEHEDGQGALTRDPSEPAGSIPVEKEGQEADDEQQAAERLVLEGVEESQHEQMLADRWEHLKHPDRL